jgi:hypothetical protein
MNETLSKSHAFFAKRADIFILYYQVFNYWADARGMSLAPLELEAL